MSKHDYSPQQALDLLMRKISTRDVDLGRHIQSAIDAGKDIEETEPIQRRSKPRVYRKTVRLTDEEALQVVLDALQAYFIELPLFVRSVAEDFKVAALSPSSQRVPISPRNERQTRSASQHGIGIAKVVEIELQTETQISEAKQDTLSLKPVEQRNIEDLQAHFHRLTSLINFSEELDSGDTH